MGDHRAVYRLSDGYANIAKICLVVLAAVSIVGSIFLSPSLVFLVLIGSVAIYLSFIRPTWSLAFLLFYLPFEQFILKWVADDLYIYAKYASEMLIYLLVVVVAWKIISGSIRLKSSPIDLQMILFLVVIFASIVINGISPWIAILGLRQIIRFILLFFVVYYLAPSKQWVKTVLFGLFIILGIQVILGASQFVIGERLDIFLFPSEGRTIGEIQITSAQEQFWDYGQRVFGTLGRYDRLGTFMAFFMLIIAGLLYQPDARQKYGRFLMPLLIAGLPVLALTYSRSAWFGFVLGFLFISVVIMRDKRVMIASGIAGAGIVLYLAFSGLVVSQLVDVSRQTVAERFFEPFSYERWRGEFYCLGRLYWMFETVKTVVPASPIFGHGPATYGGGAVTALGNTALYDKLGLPFGVYGTDGYIDNNWFSLWGETGTLGIGFYLWAYIALFFLAIRVYRKSDDSFAKGLAIGFAAAMIAVCLNAFLATFLEVRTLAVYLWTFGGIILVLAEKEKIT
ncbi:O-antigen ligase family protein [Patescibacteria group bacterium]|nr:O-antigen ligase family protein [Patescibacteria group bacterium]